MSPNGKSLPLAHIFLITLATLVTYLNSLPNGFVGDDIPFVSHNVSIRSLENIPSAFTSPGTMGGESAGWGDIIFRPLRTVSYALDYSLFGLWSPGFHATNLALHILSSLLVYLLARYLGVFPPGALLAGLLFALHPVHVEAVSWISSRADLIGFVFALLSLICYISWRRKSQPPGILFLSLGFAFLSFLGKETMVSLPGLVILYDVCFGKTDKMKNFIRVHIPVWAVYAGVCGVYLLYRYGLTGRMSTEQGWWGGTIFTNFLMMVKVAAAYLGLLIYPFKLNFHYVLKEPQTIFSADMILSFFVLGAVFTLMVYLYRNNRTGFFLVGWFFVAFVPISNLVPISFAPMSERYLYMPSAGPLIAAGAGIAFSYVRFRDSGKGARARVLAGITLLLLLSFSVRDIYRNRVYHDPFTFYSAAVGGSPRSAPSFKGLADVFLEDRKYEQAIKNYRRAKTIDPGYAGAVIGEATAFQKINRYDLAVSGAEDALSLKPEDAGIRFLAGNIFQAAGQLERARTEWERAVDLNPNFSEAYNQLGAYYQVQGDFVRADDLYREALKTNPENAETHYNLGTIYERLENMEKAREHFSRFIELSGSDYPEVVEEIRKRHPL